VTLDFEGACKVAPGACAPVDSFFGDLTEIATLTSPYIMASARQIIQKFVLLWGLGALAARLDSGHSTPIFSMGFLSPPQLSESLITA
jgi:hypothetical protein